MTQLKAHWPDNWRCRLISSFLLTDAALNLVFSFNLSYHCFLLYRMGEILTTLYGYYCQICVKFIYGVSFKEDHWEQNFPSFCLLKTIFLYPCNSLSFFVCCLVLYNNFEKSGATLIILLYKLFATFALRALRILSLPLKFSKISGPIFRGRLF